MILLLLGSLWEYTANVDYFAWYNNVHMQFFCLKKNTILSINEILNISSLAVTFVQYNSYFVNHNKVHYLGVRKYG